VRGHRRIAAASAKIPKEIARHDKAGHAIASAVVRENNIVVAEESAPHGFVTTYGDSY
jgi:hypothetical protein